MARLDELLKRLPPPKGALKAIQLRSASLDKIKTRQLRTDDFFVNNSLFSPQFETFKPAIHHPRGKWRRISLETFTRQDMWR